MTTLKTVPAGHITGSALWAAAQVRVAQWNLLARNRFLLERVQTQQLLRNVRAAEKTEYGRKHGFGRIHGHADFKRQVPLGVYGDFEPLLERMRQGERDILWPGLIEYYGQSSGSSNTKAQHKFLPISETQVRWQQKAGFDILARYLTLSGDRDLTGGFMLGLFPPAVAKPSGPVYVTSNPGLMQLRVPFPVNQLQIPRPPIRDLENYEQKLDKIAESYLDHDVRMISGTSCWFPILFEKVLAAAKRQGREADRILDLWPNLRVLFGGGVYAEPYRKIIDRLVGRPTILMDNYNATEGGLFSGTDRLDDPGMLMLPDRGVFFEFVPREEHGKPEARRFALWEVETGVDYSVALTTSSGLFGYLIGDAIRFSSVFPHRMEFTGRLSGVLSLTQELTSFIEIEKAVASAVEFAPCQIVEFAASSETDVGETAKGRYLLFIEFEKEPSDLAKFARAFDDGLCTQNRVYREHRAQDVAILAPAVVPLTKGATQQFLKQMGTTSVQHKFPRIVDGGRRDLLRTFARP